MKRVSLGMIGIGLCITVALLTVNQGYAEKEDNGPTCTLKTLKGRYLFGGIGTQLSSGWGNTAVANLYCRISYFQWRRHGDRHRDGSPQRRNRAGE